LDDHITSAEKGTREENSSLEAPPGGGDPRPPRLPVQPQHSSGSTAVLGRSETPGQARGAGASPRAAEARGLSLPQRL
jgi:hypothetical protein